MATGREDRVLGRGRFGRNVDDDEKFPSRPDGIIRAGDAHQRSAPASTPKLDYATANSIGTSICESRYNPLNTLPRPSALSANAARSSTLPSRSDGKYALTAYYCSNRVQSSGHASCLLLADIEGRRFDDRRRTMGDYLRGRSGGKNFVRCGIAVRFFFWRMFFFVVVLGSGRMVALSLWRIRS